MSLPALHGNWIDLAIVILILFYLLSWGRGLILGLVDVGGFVLSFIAALKLYSLVGEFLVVNFSLPKGIANAAGFFIAGILTELIFSVIINLIFAKAYLKLREERRKNKEIAFLFKTDQLLGFIPALVESLIFTAFILTLIITLPISGAIKKDIASSKIGSPLIAKTQRIEKQLNSIFGQAVNETLTFLTVNANPISAESVDLYFTQTQVKIDETAERVMLNLVNRERSLARLPLLTLSPQLRELAREYGRDMFARGYFSHYNPEKQSPFDRMEMKNIKFFSAGENLALAPNVQLAHQGLMNSSGHRANILSKDFRQVGIGVVDGGIYGQMFVQEFTD